MSRYLVSIVKRALILQQHRIHLSRPVFIFKDACRDSSVDRRTEKRYPTRARLEQAEKRRQELQELRQAALRAQNEAKEKRQAEKQAETSMAANVISREAEARSRPVSKALKQPLKQQDAVSKTRRKIEKLEKRLEQEKTKIQQASAKATTVPTPEIYQNTGGQSVPTQVVGNSDCEALECASSSISSDVSSP